MSRLPSAPTSDRLRLHEMTSSGPGEVPAATVVLHTYKINKYDAIEAAISIDMEGDQRWGEGIGAQERWTF